MGRNPAPQQRRSASGASETDPPRAGRRRRAYASQGDSRIDIDRTALSVRAGDMPARDSDGDRNNDMNVPGPSLAAVVAAIGKPGTWKGTASELSQMLYDRSGATTRGSAAWLGRRLRQLVPELMTAGIAVGFSRKPGTGQRLIRFSAVSPDSPAATRSDGDAAWQNMRDKYREQLRLSFRRSDLYALSIRDCPRGAERLIDQILGLLEDDLRRFLEQAAHAATNV
jgi:hypothetical protein